MPVTATLKLPECADEQAWEIARGLGWDYYVLRKKWLAFAQAETAKGNPPQKAGAAFVRWAKTQEKLRQRKSDQVTEESTAALSDQQIAHLGMIQGVINRMASNSFALKALAVTIAAAILAIAGAQQDAPASVSYVGLFPVVVFWLIDAKYLRLERLFRSLYDHIREGRDFEAFSMNTTSFNKDVSSTLRIAVSWSVIWFYLAVAAALVAVSCLPIILEKEFRS